MNSDDQVFWDRLADMPHWEAEQELVMRRESNLLQRAMIETERNRCLGVKGGTKEHARLGVEILAMNGQLTLINERLKMLRRLQEKINWKQTIKAVCGQELYEACCVYFEQQYGHISAQRAEWNGTTK